MKEKIGIIGLGYVGLPLAVAFCKKRSVLGFDVNDLRIQELRRGYDRTNECTPLQLNNASELIFSSDPSDLSDVDVFIVTVPTPITDAKTPDLRPIISATEMIASLMKPGAYVIYESTVYPGVTEEICVPILERSGRKLNNDFYCGYSPERINPGDKLHTIETIKKITSGSCELAAQFIDQLYSEVVTAGTHKASSIKVAEAAKVIENTQRDINIALINELSIIFEKLNIDTLDVLQAAETKWNFLPFKPGLVGGHCIGVDPYYLVHKAREAGFTPELISAGRKTNDSMPAHVAMILMKLLAKSGSHGSARRVLIMGMTFKENCPDTRNTKVVDIALELEEFGLLVEFVDPLVDIHEVKEEFGFTVFNEIPGDKNYDAVVLAVAHSEFLDLGADVLRRNLLKDSGVLYDLKGIFHKSESDGRL